MRLKWMAPCAAALVCALTAPGIAAAQQQTEYEKRQADEVRAQQGLRDEAARTANSINDARAAGDKARSDQRELDRLKATQGERDAASYAESARENQRRAAAAAASEEAEKRYNASVFQNRDYRDIIGNAGKLEEAGDFKHALEEYNRAEALIQTVSNQVEVYTIRGRMERKMGLYPQAIADLKRSTDLQHAHASPYIDLAWAYLEAGDTDQFQHYLGNAVATAKMESNPGDKLRTWLDLGAVRLRTGDYKEACLQLQTALDFTERGEPYMKGDTRRAAMDLLAVATLKRDGKPIPAELDARAPKTGIN